MRKKQNNGTRKMSNVLFLAILGGFVQMGCTNINTAEPEVTKMDQQTWKSRFEKRKDDYFKNDFSKVRSEASSANVNKKKKKSLPLALISIQKKDGNEAEAVSLLTDVLDPKYAKPPKKFPEKKPGINLFYITNVVHALIAFPHAFSKEQIEHIEKLARLNDDYTGGGTENHKLMRWTGGYYFAQRFGGDWKIGDQTVSAKELMAILKDKLLEEFRFRMNNAGMAEFLSPNYISHHISPIMNLVESCEDEELRQAAQAVVMLHLTHLALNVHDGYILEPHSRSGGTQFTGENLRGPNGSQYLSYVLWGTFSPGPPRLTYLGDLNNFVSGFLCNWGDLNPYLDDLANGRVQMPFSTRSVGTQWPSGKPRYPRSTLRSAYRDKKFAVGAGYQNHFPDGYYMMHGLFGITWTSDNEAAFVQCGHNYWYSDKGMSATWKAPLSPFQQMAHHENTAIVLFNVPKRDPWPKGGRADWVLNRKKHAGNLIDFAMVRLPKEVKDRVWVNTPDKSGSILFLNDNGVYIAIRSLTPAKLVSIDKNFDGIRTVPQKNGNRSQSGFIFEVGTAEKSGSFKEFQQKFMANPVKVDWGKDPDSAPCVTYTDSNGDSLVLNYNNNLTANKEGIVENMPEVIINGKALDFASWPDMEGPGVKLEKGVLTVNGKKYQIPEASLQAENIKK